MPADAPEFSFDVFLSHSAKDKAVVRDVAERLRKDGEIPKDEGGRRKDEVSIHPSSFIPHPFIDPGLERLRVLVLCMSANAFGSDWAQLRSGTFQVQGHHALRDPLNKERRFLPLRLDDTPINGSPQPKLSPFTQRMTCSNP